MTVRPTRPTPTGPETSGSDRPSLRRRAGREFAQSTVEYALILVAVTVMVGVVIAFLSGDGGGRITSLFSAAFDRMSGLVGG